MHRAACEKSACAACFAEIQHGLERMISLPGAAPFGGRHIVQIAVSGKPVTEATHRSNFALPFSPAIESLVRACLSGAIGAILVNALGPVAELCEATVVAAEPGATAQQMHSDGDYSATSPRLITLFIALHDVLDEAMGPTFYCPETHAPRCFPGGSWMPPPGDSQAQAERPPVWFALHAGDTVIMEQTCWHFGGANTSVQRRTLLCVSFIEVQTTPTAAAAAPPRRPAASGAKAKGKNAGNAAPPRLCDLIA